MNKYSIIIISKDNRKGLINCLEKLLKVIPENVEVIVVEAGDNLEKLSYNIKHIVVPAADAGFSNQRNIGVRASGSEYLIWIDDDEEPAENWFKELTKIIEEDGNLNGVMGCALPPVPTGILGFCQGVLGHPGGGFRFHHRAKKKNILLSEVSACNWLVKKSTIEKVGYFDLKNVYGSEDTDIQIRIMNMFGKNTFKYTPNAIMYHYPRTVFFKFLRWYIRRGKSDADLFLKHTVHIKYLVSTSVTLKILSVIALSIVSGWIILPSLFLIWYFLQMFRTRFMFDYFDFYKFPTAKRILTFLLFPLIKLSADIMFDLGRARRISGKWINV